MRRGRREEGRVIADAGRWTEVTKCWQTANIVHMSIMMITGSRNLCKSESTKHLNPSAYLQVAMPGTVRICHRYPFTLHCLPSNGERELSKIGDSAADRTGWREREDANENVKLTPPPPQPKASTVRFYDTALRGGGGGYRRGQKDSFQYSDWTIAPLCEPSSRKNEKVQSWKRSRIPGIGNGANTILDGARARSLSVRSADLASC